MARAPDPRIEQAKAMYLEGEKLVEIASQLNLPEGTVRRWKCTHKWDNERSDKKNERSQKRKRGAQPGNHNSSGGPPGNKKPNFSAFLFPGGPPELFLLPGCAPRLRFRERSLFLFERSLSHLCVHFQRRTVPSGRFS